MALEVVGSNPTFHPIIFLKLNNQYDPVAQSVEHKTFNLGVPGSSPGWITSGHGGIGRRAGLRIQCREAWEFKSLCPHHNKRSTFQGAFFIADLG